MQKKNQVFGISRFVLLKYVLPWMMNCMIIETDTHCLESIFSARAACSLRTWSSLQLPPTAMFSLSGRFRDLEAAMEASYALSSGEVLVHRTVVLLKQTTYLWPQQYDYISCHHFQEFFSGFVMV